MKQKETYVKSKRWSFFSTRLITEGIFVTKFTAESKGPTRRDDRSQVLGLKYSFFRNFRALGICYRRKTRRLRSPNLPHIRFGCIFGSCKWPGRCSPCCACTPPLRTRCFHTRSWWRRISRGSPGSSCIPPENVIKDCVATNWSFKNCKIDPSWKIKYIELFRSFSKDVNERDDVTKRFGAYYSPPTL